MVHMVPTAGFPYFRRNAVRAWCFIWFMARIAFVTSCKVKGFCEVLLYWLWSIFAIDSIDRFDGRFSISLKYSFHLSMIEALSVSRVEPSSLREWCCCWCAWTKHSLEFFVEKTVVAIGEVLEFVWFITPPAYHRKRRTEQNSCPAFFEAQSALCYKYPYELALAWDRSHPLFS